ncbi:neuropilin and tolloid-like protein 2 isoform X2 [Watersipora subatra]|uniref:neuropilin and tolloid-like protein 2 isoform X2 n=1 Tax=Watersipora subatra TaxID=2589382 RepID=UPI00355C6BDE
MRLSSLQLNVTLFISAVFIGVTTCYMPEPSTLVIDVTLKDIAERVSKDIDCMKFAISSTFKVYSPLVRNTKVYQPNLNCMKLINAGAGQLVEITFDDDYDIEESENCKYDSLTFQDGPFEFSPVMRKLCGKGSKAMTLRSTTNYMRLTFITDDVIEKKGFNISYRYIDIPENATNREKYRDCYFDVPFTGNQTLEISEKAVRKFYSHLDDSLTDINCVWDIRNTDGTTVWLWIDEIIQPNLINCSLRSMELYSVEHKLYEVAKPLTSGSNSCFMIRSKFFPGTSRVLFHLRSKRPRLLPFIRINFTSYREPHSNQEGQLCNESWHSCEDGRLCLDINLVCNGVYNCPDGDDESQEACDRKHGQKFGLQFIFIGAATMFFIMVTVALIVSARQMIRENIEVEERRQSSTVIINRRPSRLFQQTILRRLPEPLQDYL